MKRKYIVLFHYLLLIAGCIESNQVYDASRYLSRDKRFLVWKEGINWASIIFGVGIPFEIDHHSVNLGTAVKAYYVLPDNSSYYTNPTINFVKKRSTARWTAYKMIENYLERNHYPDGKACLLKSICQISSIKLEERSGLLAEIVQHLLMPSSTNEEDIAENYDYHMAEQLGQTQTNCAHIYPECPNDPIQQFSRLMTMSYVQN